MYSAQQCMVQSRCVLAYAKINPQKSWFVEEGPMPVEKTTIQDPTHLVSPETDRVRPTGNRRKLKQILHVAYVCESGHSPDLGPRSTDVSRGNNRRSTTSQNPKSCRYRGSNPGHTAYADALYQLDYVA